MRIQPLLACLLLACCAQAHALEDGFYVGAEAGFANNDAFITANDDGSLSMIDDDDTDTSYRAFLGYQFAPYAAFELGYSDHGELEFSATSDGSGFFWSAGDAATRFESSGWSASIVGFLPLSVRWTLTGSLGLFSWETTETFSAGAPVAIDEDSGEEVVFGVGFEFDLGDDAAWMLRGGTEITEVDDSGDAVQSLRLGLLRRF